MRAVLDPNVLISAVLSPAGAPANLVREWLAGTFELIVSDHLLAELSRALGYPKLRQRITPSEAHALVSLLRHEAVVRPDPAAPPPVRSPDPGDDYLIALAGTESAVVVSGDQHLLGLVDQIPVYSPAAFLESLHSES